MNTLYGRIDVSRKSNVVYLMLQNRDKVCNFTIVNSHDGSVQLVRRILSVLNTHSLDTVLIELKSNSVSGDNLVYFLRKDGYLASFNKKIHVLNPNQVKIFKEAYNNLPKNDFVDYFGIADCISVESTNNFTLYISSTKLFELKYIILFSQFATSQKINNVSEICYSRSILL